MVGMSHAIIEVPAMAGDPAHAAADGPAVLSAALAEAGSRVPVRRVAVSPLHGDRRAASIEVGGRVGELVRESIARGDVPLVFAGSCDVAPGVLAGIGDASVGVVWIDAHGDFNTPESSVSGFWPGMTLAVVVGDCGQDVWSKLNWRPVAPQRVALVGVRSLSPAQEARRLRKSAVRVVRWRDGLPETDLETVLDPLRAGVERVYVHLDLDALDPEVGSGVVDPPVPGGLSEQQLVEVLGKVGDRFAVLAATIATFTPAKDNGSTLSAACAAIRTLINGN
jgi:arginase